MFSHDLPVPTCVLSPPFLPTAPTRLAPTPFGALPTRHNAGPKLLHRGEMRPGSEGPSHWSCYPRMAGPVKESRLTVDEETKLQGREEVERLYKCTVVQTEHVDTQTSITVHKCTTGYSVAATSGKMSIHSPPERRSLLSST